MAVKQIAALIAVSMAFGCSRESPSTAAEPKTQVASASPLSVDRSTPSATLEAAKAALKRRDLQTYFDSLTDEAVFVLLNNSIGNCLGALSPDAEKHRYKPSPGCDVIIKKHGWVEPRETQPEKIGAAWDKAAAAVSNPRAMAAEMEGHHRRVGGGTSFVWDYLEDVRILSIEDRGGVAIAQVRWPHNDGTFEFRKDAAGWRFNPHPASENSDTL